MANKENFTEAEYNYHTKMITEQINKIHKSWTLTTSQKAKVLDRLAAVQQGLDVKRQLHANRNNKR